MQKAKNKDWKTFSEWERNYKKKFLKTLTTASAFKIFSELWDTQAKLSEKELEIFRKRRIDELIALRKSLNFAQKRLHT